MIKKLFLIICIFNFCNLAFSQTQCGLTKSYYADVYTVQTDDLYCLARNSNKDYTVFFVMSNSCSPCRKKLPLVVNFTNENKFDLYILSVEREWDYDSKPIYRTLQKANMANSEYKSILLSDSLYTNVEYRRRKPSNAVISISIAGAKYAEKYIAFLNKLTKASEKAYGYGKLIVMNKQGEIVFEDISTDGNDDFEQNILQKIEARK
jgi:hypothetical protein